MDEVNLDSHVDFSLFINKIIYQNQSMHHGENNVQQSPHMCSKCGIFLVTKCAKKIHVFF